MSEEMKELDLPSKFSEQLYRNLYARNSTIKRSIRRFAMNYRQHRRRQTSTQKVTEAYHTKRVSELPLLSTISAKRSLLPLLNLPERMPTTKVGIVRQSLPKASVQEAPLFVVDLKFEEPSLLQQLKLTLMDKQQMDVSTLTFQKRHLLKPTYFGYLNERRLQTETGSWANLCTSYQPKSVSRVVPLA